VGNALVSELVRDGSFWVPAVDPVGLETATAVAVRCLDGAPVASLFGAHAA
jgi:hypothetical protein